jgi:hypothetical protein
MCCCVSCRCAAQTVASDDEAKLGQLRDPAPRWLGNVLAWLLTLIGAKVKWMLGCGCSRVWWWGPARAAGIDGGGGRHGRQVSTVVGAGTGGRCRRWWGPARAAGVDGRAR